MTSIFDDPKILQQESDDDLHRALGILEDIRGYSDGRWNWARDTVEGIEETIHEKGYATEGQIRALRNILNRVEERG